MALAALGIALLLPTVALASHTFSDVPTNHTFHTNISNLAKAGVTAGCGGTKYCPEQPVTRGQMAGFLNRGLGRVAEGDLSQSISGTADSLVGSVTITPGISPGALPEAKQFIHAEFHGTINVNFPTGCPCGVQIYLISGSEMISTSPVRITIAGSYDDHPISTGGVIAVTGSGPLTISLRAAIWDAGAYDTTYTVIGNLVAESIPFGSTGTSAP